MVDTPWRSLLPSDGGREYLALLSYLPLKGFRKMLTLQRQTGKVRAQLASTPGLVGYSFRAKLMSHRFWTLSIWEDEPGADGLRRERSAPHHDGPPPAVPGRDRVHPMDDPRFRRPAFVGRRDGASRRDVDEMKDRQAVGPAFVYLWENPTPLVRFDDAGDRHHVRGLSHVDLLRFPHVPDAVEGAQHDAFELLIDVFFRPEEFGQVLHPLEV